MNAPMRTPLKFDIQGLLQAISQNRTNDAFSPTFGAAQWDALSGHLQPFGLAQSQLLIQQGSLDRTLYLIESGSLTVHYEDEKGRIRLAIVGGGSAVGEGAFFNGLPRNATVQAASACKLWSLTATRFTELSIAHPAVALELALALGSLVSRRLINRTKRVAVT